MFIILIAVVAVIIANSLNRPSNNDVYYYKKNTYTEEEKKPSDPNKTNMPEQVYMTEEQLSQATAVLEQGIYLEDEQNDFYRVIDGFGLPQFDLKSVTLGSDEMYLYVKYELYGEVDKRTEIDGQNMRGMGFNATLRTPEKQLVVTDYGTGVTTLLYVGQDLRKEGIFATTYFIDVPEGMSETEWLTSGLTVSNEGTLLGMGPNNDTILVAWPLDVLGLEIGDTVWYTGETENGSETEDHLVIDNLLDYPGVKCTGTVNFKIGEIDYSIDYSECEREKNGV